MNEAFISTRLSIRDSHNQILGLNESTGISNILTLRYLERI